MRILISADMEGVTGVVNWDQVTPGHPEYARFRRLFTADVNAAVRGACEAGADEVIVVDGHWDGANILVEDLDVRANLIAGSPAPLSMMQGIDETVDAVFFVGYHARHGSANAVLDHTWASKSVLSLRLNGTLTGEYGLNASVAGHFGVPVALATGDQTACAEIVDLLGDLETAVVKRSLGRFSAECLSPRLAQETIFTAAFRAVERLVQGDLPEPYVLTAPVEVRVEFSASQMAERAVLYPGARREGRLITLQTGDALAAYAGFRAVVALAGD